MQVYKAYDIIAWVTNHLILIVDVSTYWVQVETEKTAFMFFQSVLMKIVTSSSSNINKLHAVNCHHFPYNVNVK